MNTTGRAHRYLWILLLAFAMTLLSSQARARGQSAAIFFEPNQGQSAPGVDFIGRAPGLLIFISPERAVMAIDDADRPADGARLLSIGLVGAAPDAAASAVEMLPGVSNYIIGNEPDEWLTGVPHLSGVRYAGVYPGVDMVWRGDGALEYDVVVAPGGDPASVRLEFDGHDGLRITPEGGLEVTVGNEKVLQRAPIAFQEIDGERVEVAASFRLFEDHTVGFEVAGYDPARELTIDPVVLGYSTYVGGSLSDSFTSADPSIAADGSGMAFVAGTTFSTDLLTTPGAAQPGILGTTDAFVVKIDPTKTGAASLVYSTYLGSTNRDTALSVAVDSIGRAFVSGATWGTDLPTTPGAYKGSFAPSGPDEEDGFVAVLSEDGGSLYYSTYFGGDRDDAIVDIALRDDNVVYMTGETHGGGTFPTTAGAYDTTGTYNAVFLSVLDISSNTLRYSTFIEGSSMDYGRGVAVDKSGRAYLTGIARSTDFPTTPGAFMPTAPANMSSSYGRLGSYFTLIDPSLTGAASLVYSTYLGAGDAADVSVDNNGNAFVTGYTTDPAFPTTQGALNTACVDLVLPDGTNLGCAGDAFVMRIDPTLTGAASLIYSTRLGGIGGDAGKGIAVDGAGYAVVTGSSSSADFPVRYGLSNVPMDETQSLPGLLAYNHAFVSKLTPTGNRLAYSTLFGGTGDDTGRGIAADGTGAVYITGLTGSADLPIVNGYDASYKGGVDAFLAKLTYDACPDDLTALEDPPGWEWEEPACIVWDTNEWGIFTGTPRKCPTLECRYCSIWMTEENIAVNPPVVLPGIYHELLAFTGSGSEPKRAAASVSRLSGLVKKAPEGRYFTGKMKTRLLGAIEGLKTTEAIFSSPATSKEGKAARRVVRVRKADSPRDLRSEFIAAVNAMELDWRLPETKPVKVGSGEHAVAGFGGVAWTAVRGVEKPGKLTLKVESGLPASVPGYVPGWPAATYAFEFTGALGKSGYADLTVYAGGTGFSSSVKELRMLEWDGRGYRDITTTYDRSRGTITGRARFRDPREAIRVVVVEAIPCRPFLYYKDRFRVLQGLGQ